MTAAFFNSLVTLAATSPTDVRSQFHFAIQSSLYSPTMKFYILSLLLALLAITVSAIAPQKAIIITYPKHTPDSVVQDAMKAIKEAGGVITHEYSKSEFLRLIIDVIANNRFRSLQRIRSQGFSQSTRNRHDLGRRVQPRYRRGLHSFHRR